MKTKYWVMLLCIILAICLGFSIPLLFPGEDARFAEILSDGQRIRIVDLNVDAQFTIPSPNGGENTVAVKDGKIGVTAATCPDHYCMDRGLCSNGVQIVCLPNRLIIRFLDSPVLDAVVG